MLPLSTTDVTALSNEVWTGAIRESGTYSPELKVGDHHNQEGFGITSFGPLPTLHFDYVDDGFVISELSTVVTHLTLG